MWDSNGTPCSASAARKAIEFLMGTTVSLQVLNRNVGGVAAVTWLGTSRSSLPTGGPNSSSVTG